MRKEYQAIIQRAGDLWIGWITEIPGVNAEAATREHLLENLRSALREALEINRTEVVSPGNSFEDVIVFETAPQRGPPATRVGIKRHELLAHLLNEGCVLFREGGNQSWWVNPAKNRQCGVPHLTDFAFLGIGCQLARKICGDLEIKELVDTIVSHFQ